MREKQDRELNIVMTNDMPYVHYDVEKYTDEEAEEKVDNIIRKFNAGESPTEFLEVRKKQILNHSNRDSLIKTLNSLTGMFGEQEDEYNKALMNTLFEELNILHCPMVFNLPTHTDEDFKGKEIEEWSLDELFSEYLLLCNLKGWEDHYTLTDKVKGFKNYQVMDMLNDLSVNEVIMSYLIYSDVMEESRLLEEFDSDESVIEVIRCTGKDWGTGDYVHTEDL